MLKQQFNPRSRAMKTFLIAAAAMLAAVPALAADPLYEEGLSARVGAMFSTADTRLRVDAGNGAAGTTVTLEDNLGYSKNETLPTFDATWRINPRHRIEVGYAALSRDAQKTIAGEIRFGDTVFPVNTNVNSKFESDIWRLTYGWSFYREGGNELSLLLGMHVTGFKTKLEGSGGRLAETSDYTVPLPTIGLQGSWAFDPQWRLSGWVQVFSLKYNDYDGSLVNGAFTAEYRINRNLAVGAGYTIYDYNLDVTKSRSRASFDYQFAGPVLYLNAGF
jgi:hypothetical protein